MKPIAKIYRKKIVGESLDELQCWFETSETGRFEFPKIRYLAGEQYMRPTHDTQYAIFMDKTFCRGAYAKKKKSLQCLFFR